MPVQRCKDAWRAADRNGPALHAPWSLRSKSPATSTPTTTSLHQRRITGKTKVGVYGGLRPLPKRETIGQHLDATRVERGHSDVHVPDQDIYKEGGTFGHSFAGVSLHSDLHALQLASDTLQLASSILQPATKFEESGKELRMRALICVEKVFACKLLHLFRALSCLKKAES